MPKKKKTKSEKIRSGYRLDNFTIKASEQVEKKERKEFGYLDRKYVGRDLVKTAIYSVLILGLLIVAKRFFG